MEKQSYTFSYDFFNRYDNRTIFKILRDTNKKELTLALKLADTELQEIFFRNMSIRTATMIKEDMEILCFFSQKKAEEAQKKIVSQVILLEDKGEIIARD